MGLMERLEKQKVNGAANSDEEGGFEGGHAANDSYAGLKKKTHAELVEILNAEESEKHIPEKDREEYILAKIDALISASTENIPRADRKKIVKEIYNDVIGLGPLEPLLENPDVTEIMVNGPYNVYIERRGKLELSSAKFNDNEHVMNVINRIVSSIGRRIDESSPMVDARLADGSRVNAIIPPLSLVGPVITIRKFSKRPLTINDLIRFNSVSPKMMTFLDACVKGKMNIIVSGGTGSGKTTLLNVLSSYIPETDRIVTIEDAAELQLRQNHVITLESRPANIEGVGQITIRDLVRNALRMRPDRIIVGEVRSGETLDMLQAMNTGHDGSLTTAHANSPRDLISRLETMVLMSGMDMPVKAIREQVASALDIIVHQARLKDGTRKIVSITEVVGMEGDTITLQELYAYKSSGVDVRGNINGEFISTGVRPSFVDKLAAGGVIVRDDWFTN